MEETSKEIIEGFSWCSMEFMEDNVFKLIQIDHNIVIGKNDSVFTTITLVISTSGIMLSFTSIILLILTACLFEEWRKSYKNQLLIQMILSRFLYNFVRYFFDVRRLTDFCERYDCIVHLDKYFMIYTEINSVSWTFIFTKQMYDSLVRVFVNKPNIWMVSIIAPAVSSIIAFIVYSGYKLHSNLIFYFLYIGLMKWPVLLLNAVMLISILKAIIKSNKTKENRSNIRPICVMIMLMFTMCFHHMFLDFYKIIHAYYDLPPSILVACHLLTMYQGIVSVNFWVFGNDSTRKMWKNLMRDCCCIKSKKIVISSGSNQVPKESEQC